MRKKLGRMLISSALALSLATGALAADPANMTDISGHWAQEAIGFCLTENLYQGVSETEFDPEGTMTRAMFVTVLGRIMEVNPGAYQDWYLGCLYTDMDTTEYYAPYVNWATRMGIIQGNGDGTVTPDEPITREQMATMVIRFASICNFEISSSADFYVDWFTDSDQISEYAQSSVDTLKMTGIINGYANDDGTYRFEPQGTATRAECATLFYRLDRALRPYEGREIVDPTGIYVMPDTETLKPGETAYLSASVQPEAATNKTVTWFSTDRSVVQVDHTGLVTAVGLGTAEVYGYTWNGEYQCCRFTVEQDKSLAYDGESYTDKCIRIFGQVVDDPRTFYDIDDTSYLVTIPVQVWDFTDSTYTTKYSKTIYLQVHRNIADTVQAIFQEIYEGDEQFPINSAGGYYRSSLSEHTPGLAIDINPYSNYYCDPYGNAITGSHWDPENDPYSIPLNGDVVNAFKKYGFTQGIYWRSGYKDYMHFSFFAT